MKRTARAPQIRLVLALLLFVAPLAGAAAGQSPLEEESFHPGAPAELPGEPAATSEEPPDLSWAGEPVALSEVRHGSLMLKTTHPDLFYALPTVDTSVDVTVTGLVARTRVVQRYDNPSDEWVEGVYAFPLPETAAVDRLRLIVGQRVIEGEIQEREEAERTYQAAKKAGKKASLLSQERPNLFTTAVANIGPKEGVQVEIEYQEDLRYDAGKFRLRFPMVVAPRYIPGSEGVAALDGTSPADPERRDLSLNGTGWAVNTPQVPDASRITPAVMPPEHGPINPVSIRVALDTGLPVDRIHSPSHAIDVFAETDWQHTVLLSQDVVAADSDFVLEWTPAPAYAPQAALFGQELDGEHYALLLVMPPEQPQDGTRLPREVIFVIDTSGSMHGASMIQAQSALTLALGSLGPKDRFNVIQFNSTTERLYPMSAPVTQRSLSEARTYVQQLQAGGGTEMFPALEAALDRQGSDAEAVRQVIFITDGSVGNEDELFSFIQRHLGPSRLFTVGIGSAPNSFFMRKAAQFGRGTFTYIGSPSEVAGGMGELFRKLEAPMLSDIEVEWGDGPVEVWPPQLPDLYLGEPVMVVARLPRLDGEVRVRGRRAEETWEVSLPLGDFAAESGLDKLWARKKIGALMDRLVAGADAAEVRRAVVDLGLKHGLVSKYTSLVAVDRQISRPQGEGVKTRPLPVNLPQGWTPQQVHGALPQGGTALRLLMGLGLLSILAGMFLGVRSLGRRAP